MLTTLLSRAAYLIAAIVSAILFLASVTVLPVPAPAVAAAVQR